MTKLSPVHRREIGWLAGIALAGFVLGLLFGQPLLLALLFVAAYAVWLLWRFEAIARWLAQGGHAATAPPTVGLGNQIVGLVHREKKYSRKQKHRFKNALAQFNNLAAELPDATIVLDAHRQIRWSNAAAQSLLNVHPERDRGQRIDNLIRAPGFRELLLNGERDDTDTEFEIPTGSGRTLAIRNVPSGNRMSVLIARDVTQRVKVREMRKAFVDDVSHELRTPLTVIEGYLEMLREDPTLEGPTSVALDHVAAQSSRMRNIVEHLLQLSRLEGEALADGEGDTVAVGFLLRDMVGALVATDTSVRREQIQFEVDESLALVGAESEVWSACNNLLINALKYGGQDCTVRISWRLDPEGRPTYAVEDDGPGIEARHLPRLSERFYRVDPHRSRASGGTGLGLAIVKHATQRHGGQLAIESTPGVGSRFAISFPASRAVMLRTAANG